MSGEQAQHSLQDQPNGRPAREFHLMSILERLATLGSGEVAADHRSALDRTEPLLKPAGQLLHLGVRLISQGSSIVPVGVTLPTDDESTR